MPRPLPVELQPLHKMIISYPRGSHAYPAHIDFQHIARTLVPMCNLYRLTKSDEEVANIFRADNAAVGSNRGALVYPAYPGLVIASGVVGTMIWGFPLAMKGKRGQPLKPSPVNNARADKLDSFMWRYSFAERRCLIPMTAFAEAEGPKGAKTRTWISLPDQSVFAAAGIWRDTEEWGPTFSMVMTGACVHVADVHDRMPVILQPEHYDVWQREAPEAARELCQPYAGAMMIDRTDEPWLARRPS